MLTCAISKDAKELNNILNNILDSLQDLGPAALFAYSISFNRCVEFGYKCIQMFFKPDFPKSIFGETDLLSYIKAVKIREHNTTTCPCDVRDLPERYYIVIQGKGIIGDRKFVSLTEVDISTVSVRFHKLRCKIN